MDDDTFMFKLGDKTRNIWCGDLISECEFITNLGQGRMLFYDIDYKCFRLVFLESYDGGNTVRLNGWKAASSITEILQKL